jgi:hypothetical protein
MAALAVPAAVLGPWAVTVATVATAVMPAPEARALSVATPVRWARRVAQSRLIQRESSNFPISRVFPSYKFFKTFCNVNFN